MVACETDTITLNIHHDQCMREDVIIFESGIGSNGRSLQGEIQFNVITFNAAMATSEKQMLGTIVLGEPFATSQVGAQRIHCSRPSSQCMRRTRFLEVRRIGEAQNPGPGAHRSHRRGKRSCEAQALRRARCHRCIEENDTLADVTSERWRGSHDRIEQGAVAEKSMIFWHINIQGLRSHTAELVGRIRLATEAPHILCLNETFLDQTVGDVAVEGYALVARWDRSYERGGVCIYASKEISQKVTLQYKSEDAERLWCMLHTDQGPFLLGAWYRPPSPETASMETCEREHEELAAQTLGTLLLGDLNVHHVDWLTHSNSTSAGGKRLRLAAAAMGLNQLVREPTRGNYLLDLALSDIPGASAIALPKIADHSIVQVKTPLLVPEVESIEREVWKFAAADWDRLDALL